MKFAELRLLFELFSIRQGISLFLWLFKAFQVCGGEKLNPKDIFVEIFT